MNFKIAVLNNAHEKLEIDQFKEIFYKIIEMRLRGYKSHYGKLSYIPIDSIDFFGTHIAIGEQEHNKFTPFLAWRAVTLSQCNEFHINYPAYNLVKGNANEYNLAIDKFVSKSEKENTELGYFGSLTIDPYIKNDPLKLREVFDIFYTTIYFTQRDLLIKNAIMSATLKFGTKKTFKRAGFKVLSNQDKELAPFQSYALGDSEALLFHTDNKYSEYVLNLLPKFESLWLSKIDHSVLYDEFAA